jgi:hypothetical protein
MTREKMVAPRPLALKAIMSNQLLPTRGRGAINAPTGRNYILWINRPSHDVPRKPHGYDFYCSLGSANQRPLARFGGFVRHQIRLSKSPTPMMAMMPPTPMMSPTPMMPPAPSGALGDGANLKKSGFVAGHSSKIRKGCAYKSRRRRRLGRFAERLRNRQVHC